MENVERLPGFYGNRIAAWRSRLHRGVVAKVHELWRAREVALIDAMVIGEEAFIDRDTRIDFQRSGTYHVLIVSGMNVTILAFIVFWTLRRFRVGRYSRHTAHHRNVRELRVHHRGRGAGVAGHAYVRRVSVGAPAVSRSCHAQCDWRGGAGAFDRRSTTAFFCQFSDDVRMRADRGGHRHSDSRSKLTTL